MTDTQVSPTLSVKKVSPVKKLPTLGDLIVEAYDVSEKSQAAGMVSLALEARLIHFERPRRPATFDRTNPFARE